MTLNELIDFHGGTVVNTVEVGKETRVLVSFDTLAARQHFGYAVRLNTKWRRFSTIDSLSAGVAIPNN